MELRSDWWGPIPPLIYGEWPGSVQIWEVTLIIVQMTLFFVGFRYITSDKHSPQSLPIFLLNQTLLIVGLLFCLQLWRDATLLSLVTFGFGLIKLASEKNTFKIIIFFFGVIAVILGALCKIIFAPLIAFLFILNLRFFNPFPKFNKLLKTTLFLSLSIIPIFLNFFLVNTLNLKNTFPEQQPMIFDLASLYCWGTSIESNQDAIRILKLTKKNGYPDEAICSSLEPMGWDTLRTDRPLWKYSSPIMPLDNELEVKELSIGWIQTIVNHPTEYLQVKIIQSTQVLTMANFLGPRTDRAFLQFQIQSVLKKFVQVYTFLPRVLDRLRFFSLGFFISVLIAIIWRETLRTSLRKWDPMSREFSLTLILLLAVFQLIVTTFGFVSANGRYSFPFVLIGIIFLVREFSYIKSK
jgi:hypothetical protein